MNQQRVSSILLLGCLLGWGALDTTVDAAESATPAPVTPLAKIENAPPRNVIFILTDDHRFDALGCMNHPFLKTPHLDSLAKHGVHLTNAFVTTSLCSPSRASILTGQYAHRHRVIDNNFPVSDDLVFFPQYLQQAGYVTAFVGKWHMGGESDVPQRGFDHWLSFKGQGHYLPGPKIKLNRNGQVIDQEGYITDLLTTEAVQWLRQRPQNQPFFLYLSHKAVHSNFTPAERHRGVYANVPVTSPRSIGLEYTKHKPMWVQNQRNSWHGVDFPYHSRLDVAEYYRRYCETLLGVDESVGVILQELQTQGILDSTVVCYMGDNGFMFGEHGLIDKRTAHEASMRVPMLIQCPAAFQGGRQLPAVVANIDIAPTLLQAAGLQAPPSMDGRSFWSLLEGKEVDWRDALLYEYYWEKNFPQTPTTFAIRGDRYKLIQYYGIWDTDELYDLQADPEELNNLINDPDHQKIVRQLRDELFVMLEKTDGMELPLKRFRGGSANLRSQDGSPAADFPEHLLRELPPNQEAK